MFMTIERIPLIEYLAVILPTKAVFIFRQPPLSYVSNIYYLPFHSSVWFAIILLIVLSTFLVHLTYRYSMQDAYRRLTISDFFLYAINTICQMGSAIRPHKLSGKIASVSGICNFFSFVPSFYSLFLIFLIFFIFLGFLLKKIASPTYRFHPTNMKSVIFQSHFPFFVPFHPKSSLPSPFA